MVACDHVIFFDLDLHRQIYFKLFLLTEAKRRLGSQRHCFLFFLLIDDNVKIAITVTLIKAFNCRFFVAVISDRLLRARDSIPEAPHGVRKRKLRHNTFGLQLLSG